MTHQTSDSVEIMVTIWVSPMELETRHQILYSNKHSIPLAEAAKSLNALDKIFRQSTYSLERLLPGLKVLDMDIFIDKIEAGSLWESMIVKFL